jgi:hypothetical protein
MSSHCHTMDPRHGPGFQQQPAAGGPVGFMSLGYPPHPYPPLPMPPTTATQQGYGVPYQLMPPYPSMLPQGYGYGQYQLHQGWGPYTPHFPALPTAPMPNTMMPPHAATWHARAPPPPAGTPLAHRQFVKTQWEPGGK